MNKNDVIQDTKSAFRINASRLLDAAKKRYFDYPTLAVLKDLLSDLKRLNINDYQNYESEYNAIAGLFDFITTKSKLYYMASADQDFDMFVPNAVINKDHTKYHIFAIVTIQLDDMAAMHEMSHTIDKQDKKILAKNQLYRLVYVLPENKE